MKKTFYLITIFLIMGIFLLTACGTKPYNVSGKVIDLQEEGVSGVTINFSGGFSGETSTTGNGSWNMIGLKGTVKITPYKAGWVFNPREKSVSGETTNIVFQGTDDPLALINDMLARYCEEFNSEDANGVINFFHSSYYTRNNLTYEEHLANIQQRFQTENMVVEIKNSDITLNNDTAEAILILGTQLNGLSSVDYVWEFSLIREGFNWLITDLKETVYQAYLERPYIEDMLSDFMDYFSNENIQGIDSLTSENYSYDAKNKAGFLQYLEELFNRIDIYSYEYEIKDINAYDDQEFYVSVTVNTDMSTDGLRSDRTLEFGFTLVKELNQWLVLQLKIEGDEIKVFELTIDEADGETDYIEILVPIEGEYTIKTDFYQEECDTYLYLYDANYELLAENDDQNLHENRYSLINYPLNSEVYYVKITEFYEKHLYCYLEVIRVGL